jgi:YHS domain-containing protein
MSAAKCCRHKARDLDPRTSSIEVRFQLRANPEKEDDMTIDPVCGMKVDETKAAAKGDYQGVTYYFCSAHCHKTFTAAPEKYAKTGAVGTEQRGKPVV